MGQRKHAGNHCSQDFVSVLCAYIDRKPDFLDIRTYSPPETTNGPVLTVLGTSGVNATHQRIVYRCQVCLNSRYLLQILNCSCRVAHPGVAVQAESISVEATSLATQLTDLSSPLIQEMQLPPSHNTPWQANTASTSPLPTRRSTTHISPSSKVHLPSVEVPRLPQQQPASFPHPPDPFRVLVPRNPVIRWWSRVGGASLLFSEN